MRFLAAGTLAVRAGRAVTLVAAGLPWKQFHCRYATKQKKVTNIIRWNTENKMLFGAKQKPASATRQKAAQAQAATKRGSKTSPGEQQTTGTKTKNTTSRKKDKTLKPTPTAAESTDSVDSSQVNDSGGQWWDEDRMPGNEQRKRDTFSAENEHYNRIVDNGQGYYEGSEDSSSSDSWSSRSRRSSGGGVNIPQILPIPGSLNKHGTDTRKTTKAPKTRQDVSLSAPSFQGAAVIQKFPLLPSEFDEEGEVRSSAEEFRSYVDSLKLRVLPTVNSVLNKTRPDLSNFFLQRWREKMIGELGEEGFRKHQEATIWAGTNLHACIQQFLSGLPLSEVEVPEKNKGHWESISGVLREVSEIQAVESSVSHPWLCYKGTFDCVAKYRNTLCVIDWKTSSKPKPLLSNLYDNPLQVAAYLGAINMTPDLTQKFGVMDQAAIIVAYANGESAHVHRIQPALCQHYWSEWCQRLMQYWTAVAAEKGGYTL